MNILQDVPYVIALGRAPPGKWSSTVPVPSSCHDYLGTAMTWSGWEHAFFHFFLEENGIVVIEKAATELSELTLLLR